MPIHQTVAYAFDSADHGAALFNLEVEGHRYSRISNPTNAVLEKRVAALEGGVGALAVATGQAALHYSVLNLCEAGANLVSAPQLYGTTHTLFAHILPRLGIKTRFAKSDSPADIEPLIDGDTRAVFCESVGNPAGNICDIEALAAAAHRHGVPLIVDNTVATPILLRPFDYGAVLVAGAPHSWRVPHSRFNELRADELVAGNYRPLACSPVAGVDSFIKDCRSSSGRTSRLPSGSTPRTSACWISQEASAIPTICLRGPGSPSPASG